MYLCVCLYVPRCLCGQWVLAFLLVETGSLVASYPRPESLSVSCLHLPSRCMNVQLTQWAFLLGPPGSPSESSLLFTLRGSYPRIPSPLHCLLLDSCMVPSLGLELQLHFCLFLCCCLTGLGRAEKNKFCQASLDVLVLARASQIGLRPSKTSAKS